MNKPEKSDKYRIRLVSGLISFFSFCILFFSLVVIGERLELNPFLISLFGGLLSVYLGNKIADTITGVNPLKEFFQ